MPGSRQTGASDRSTANESLPAPTGLPRACARNPQPPTTSRFAPRWSRLPTLRTLPAHHNRAASWAGCSASSSARTRCHCSSCCCPSLHCSLCCCRRCTGAVRRPGGSRVSRSQRGAASGRARSPAAAGGYGWERFCRVDGGREGCVARVDLQRAVPGRRAVPAEHVSAERVGRRSEWQSSRLVGLGFSSAGRPRHGRRGRSPHGWVDGVPPN